MWSRHKSIRAELEQILYEALMEEVATTPKPGLVDRHDNGAHRDMNLKLFFCSADAIAPYLGEMFELGSRWQLTPELLFLQIRRLGIQAEAAMYRATQGVNTHKGAIFTLGILSAAAGLVWQDGKTFTAEEICARSRSMTAVILEAELTLMKNGVPRTKGERMFQKYGTLGIRGIAADGYSFLLEVAVPYMRIYRKNGLDENEANINVLLKIIECLEDTNVLSRGSMEDLVWLQKRAASILNRGGAFSEEGMRRIRSLNRNCVARNISPGGAADLLAATLFLWKLEQLSAREEEEEYQKMEELRVTCGELSAPLIPVGNETGSRVCMASMQLC